MLMDNATIHNNSILTETAIKMKSILIFNAQYSPWLNPVERYFAFIKTKLQPEDRSSK